MKSKKVYHLVFNLHGSIQTLQFNHMDDALGRRKKILERNPDLKWNPILAHYQSGDGAKYVKLQRSTVRPLPLKTRALNILLPCLSLGMVALMAYTFIMIMVEVAGKH